MLRVSVSSFTFLFCTQAMALELLNCPNDLGATKNGCSLITTTIANSEALVGITPVEAVYTVDVKYPCGSPNSRLPSQIYLSADKGVTWGGPLILGQNSLITLRGYGPIILKDDNAARTAIRAVAKNCSIDLNYVTNVSQIDDVINP